MKDLKNLKDILSINDDVSLFKENIKYDKNNAVQRYLYNSAKLGFIHFSTKINEEDMQELEKNTGQKRNMKAFYFKEITEEGVYVYFQKFIEGLLIPELKGLYFSIEVMNARYIAWHNDIGFNSERGSIYGNLIWYIEGGQHKLESKSSKAVLKKDNMYFLHDKSEHRLLPARGRKRSPCSMIVIKFYETPYYEISKKYPIT